MSCDARSIYCNSMVQKSGIYHQERCKIGTAQGSRTTCMRKQGRLVRRNVLSAQQVLGLSNQKGSMPPGTLCFLIRSESRFNGPIVSYVSDCKFQQSDRYFQLAQITQWNAKPGMPKLAILCKRRMHNPGFTLTFDTVRPGTGDLTRIRSTLLKFRTFPTQKSGRSPVIFTRRIHPQLPRGWKDP